MRPIFPNYALVAGGYQYPPAAYTFGNSVVIGADNTANVNQLQIAGSTAGQSLSIAAFGSDASITISYTAKGTGGHMFVGGGDVQAFSGNFRCSTAGKGLMVRQGGNAKIGVAALVAGTVVVANALVTNNSRIFLSVSTAGGTVGSLSYTKTAGVGFTINSSSPLETSAVDWFIVESIP